MLTIFVMSIFYFSGVKVLAMNMNPCLDEVYHVNSYKIQTLGTVVKQQLECRIMLGKKHSTYSNKRFIWNSNGKFMIYHVSLEPQSSQPGTAKSFYFLPAKQPLKLSLLDADRIQISQVNSTRVIFNTQTDTFELIEGVEFQQNRYSTVNSPNFLGILATNNVVFELGQRRGGDPEEDSVGALTVHTPKKTCRGLNLHLFKYSNEEPKVRIKESSDLERVVERLCR